MSEIPASCSGRTALEIALDAARQAGAVLLDRFHTAKKITEKSRGNIVTDVDHEAERLIIGRLVHEYPDFGILAEESGQSCGKAEYMWIIDPLDGTRNYASGVPYFAVNVALARGNDVLIGVTYDPNRNEMFEAEKGHGARLNGVRMGVSSQSTLRACLMGTDMGYSDLMGRHVLQLLEAFWPDMQGVRVMGSAALGLAYAAAGRLDIYFHHLLSPWDFAPGVLLGIEAGGKVTNRNGQTIDFLEDRSILLSNSTIHRQFLDRSAGLPWREGGR